MRWPWVSRARHMEVRRAWIDARNDLSSAVVALHDQRDLSERRYADLLAKYHALKVAGASAPEPARTALVRPDNPIMDAISLASGADMERRGFLGAWATEQRLRGRVEEDIVHELLNWKSVDDDDAETFS